MAKLKGDQVMTANRLGDGRVVYLGCDGWTDELGAARILQNETDIGTAEATAREAVADRQIVEPYLIEVETECDGIQPRRLREKIRAEGPTTGNSRRVGVAA